MPVFLPNQNLIFIAITHTWLLWREKIVVADHKWPSPASLLSMNMEGRRFHQLPVHARMHLHRDQ